MMGLRDLFRRNDTGANIANRDEIVSWYKRLRAVGLNLNSKLVKRLNKDVLDEGGKKLGFLRKGVFVFDSEDESSVLMDYCLYDVRRNGRNTIEQYLLDSPPAPESDEMVCLRSMQQAVYSLFIVESVIRGFGVTVRDLLSNKSVVIVDFGFGRTAQSGLVFASRLLFHEGFAMTSGAALPVGVLPEGERRAMIAMLSGVVTPDQDGRFDPAPLIRTCLERGCSSHVQYQEPTERPARHRPEPGRPRSPQPSRNAPCPCGSGKKFKNCCMMRQAGGP
jgi:hypothetical protein